MRRYVGERIKKLREAQEMTLAQVCKLTGIEAARLSAYEEGTEVPAIGAVIQLSRVLGSKVEGLLHGGGTVSEALTICRSGDSLGGVQGDTEQAYSYSSLTRPGSAGHLMEPFLLSFDPDVPQGAAITHDGQEFVYATRSQGEGWRYVSTLLIDPYNGGRIGNRFGVLLLGFQLGGLGQLLLFLGIR